MLDLPTCSTSRPSRGPHAPSFMPSRRVMGVDRLSHHRGNSASSAEMRSLFACKTMIDRNVEVWLRIGDQANHE